MQNISLEISYNSRVTYFAIKNLMSRRRDLTSLKYDDCIYVIRANYGALNSPLCESVRIHIIAESNENSKVLIESSSEYILNMVLADTMKGLEILRQNINNEILRLMNTKAVSIF